jgi:superfamily I DNA and RNA helicase
MNSRSKFIITEVFDSKGEATERLVWQAIKKAFQNRMCLGYWRYPIFSNYNKIRKEPDILIVDRDLGLIIIEVKGIKIDNIIAIQGHRWEYQNFYTDYGNPYQQAENQLFALLNYTDKEPLLAKKITARAIVALPNITQAQWHNRGYDRLPTNPPILFKDDLDCSSQICETIENFSLAIAGEKLSNTQWELLLAILSGSPIKTKPELYRNRQQNRSKIIQQARQRLDRFDLQQEIIGKQIPPGMQRIRGIAGSGKTIILCQKAAIMHVKHPEWKIAFVFFSRSLYDSITEQIDRWIRYFTKDKQSYDSQQSNLKIFHAWGSKKQPGFYSNICKLTGTKPLSAWETESKQPNEALAEACVKLLETTAIPEVYDAILIDEGQDLIVEHWKYQNKQSFYWLAYQTLRPVNPIHPEQKRLIWAYDELQSLDCLHIPNTCELFGEELGHLVTGKYANEINKTEIMTRCYRTPHRIIITAHAIAMGLLRQDGILTGSIYPEEWEALGYQLEVIDRFNKTMRLKRLRNNSPNLIEELWQDNILEFNRFSSRYQELTGLANNLKYNLQQEGLQPDGEILIIVLGSFSEATDLAEKTAIFLIDRGINIYLPTNRDRNILRTDLADRLPDRFWYEGAVTISTIHRAKGQEADLVYLIGLDNLAKDESNIYLRNQLFVALTRTKGWVYLSGIGHYSLYEELSEVIDNSNNLEFKFTQPQRNIIISDRAELLEEFALGRRNFRQVNLTGIDLSHLYLANINLIDANLSHTNLSHTDLSQAKLIAVNLSHADLSHANLSKTKLIGANLSHAKFDRTNLTQADLTNANLTDTILSLS